MAGSSLLSRGQFDGEGAAQWVHLVRARFPGHRGVGGHRCRRPGNPVGRGPAAVLAVDEQLADLLGHCNVVHHYCELSCVHRALICKTRVKNVIGNYCSNNNEKLKKKTNKKKTILLVSPEVKAHRLQKVC